MDSNNTKQEITKLKPYEVFMGFMGIIFFVILAFIIISAIYKWVGGIPLSDALVGNLQFFWEMLHNI